MKNITRAAVATVAACTLLTAAPTASLASAPATASAGGHQGLQATLDQAVTAAGLPGAMAEVRNDGATWFGQAGTADLNTGRPLRPQDRFRIGSTTKTFVATALLQLEAEHRLSLDDSVEQWLPGLVDGNGYDGSRITLRQLLNHTSGVANFAVADQVSKDFQGLPFLQHRFDSFTPRQLVRLGTSVKPDFAPGTGWRYSDTNYVLAGLVIEQATGHSLAQEITDRFVKPLHLKSTYEPTGDDTGIRGPHGRFYSKLGSMDAPTLPEYDVTELNPSWGYGSGDLISTTGDLSTFFQALLAGRLLPPAQAAEMFTMQDPGNAWIPQSHYGLGVASLTLSCGQMWGMGGAINGSWSYTFGTRDGRHLLSTEVNGDWADGEQWGPISVFTKELEAEFCGHTGA
ncbi:serine hydrolase domain-containing protein [Kitasatospora aureofaciens]|uniref:serine hydrolase domain-containing protein n=1 Tax=Kitasatospora aureofaciens TaxID=1894 RepID=UPI001DBC6955|nr:serine hydrolase domain-containing protein [Kitasatospora aureofaciens]HJD81603.1 beta-lactamase family protein [Kitasatospora aureofaciens]